MKIDNEFTVSVPIDRAWAVLTDLEGIAPCMPGAQLTGVAGEVYSGKVRIRVGPVTSEYAGTARFVERDDVNYRAVIDAKGRDARAAGNASAAVTAWLRADGDRTVVAVDTDLRISGKVAQFGSGMIKEVSEKLLAQFVARLEAKLAAELPVAPAQVAADGSSVAVGAGPQVGPAAAGREGDVASPASPAAPDSTAAGDTTTTTGPPARVDASTPAGGGGAAKREISPAAEPEPLDLMRLAGSSAYKRILPVAVLLVIIAAVIVYLVVR